MSNLVDVVVADKNLATLLKSVKASGLESILAENGPFTVFAPTDMAFGKLGSDELAELLKPENKVKLTDLLNDHVVRGKTNFKDLKDGKKLTTLGGHELTVKTDNGKVCINGATVQARDHEASNGVIHSMDTVMVSSESASL
jgi:uncharacterized surface protein with fasciclin (FAS1) repeats